MRFVMLPAFIGVLFLKATSFPHYNSCCPKEIPYRSDASTLAEAGHSRGRDTKYHELPQSLSLTETHLQTHHMLTYNSSKPYISPTQFWPARLGQMFAKFLQLGSSLRLFISSQNLMAHLAHL